MTQCTCPVPQYTLEPREKTDFWGFWGLFPTVDNKTHKFSSSEKRELRLREMIIVTLWGCYLFKSCSWTRQAANCSVVTYLCDGPPQLGHSWESPLSTASLSFLWNSRDSSGAFCHQNVMSFGVCCHCPFITVDLAYVKDINWKEKGNKVQLIRLCAVRRYRFFLTISCNYFSCR